jgi:hypothetical protein
MSWRRAVPEHNNQFSLTRRPVSSRRLAFIVSIMLGLFLLAASPGGAWTYPQGVPELDIIFSDGFEAEDNPNHDPVIISTPVTGGQVGVTYFYDVDATDADGDLLSFELTSLPVGMSIDPDSGEISWDPLESGSFPVGKSDWAPIPMIRIRTMTG